MAKSSRAYDRLPAERIVALVRLGSYPHAAAEAAGLPREIFQEWWQRGEKNGGRQPFRGFVRQIRQAIAQGRVKAEMAVYEKDPKFWLGHGPGRETASNPGWTGEVKADVERATESAVRPQWMELSAAVLEALAPFPEARLAVAEALRP